jgi:hypothetical protein
LEATILMGPFKGEDVLIPLILTDMPFKFKRLQFPIQLAFAITINKSQGQSLELSGLDLSTDCFSHGRVLESVNRTTCTYPQTMVQQRILYTNTHCDIKHIINVRFLFPFISNSATLSHSEAWPGTASIILNYMKPSSKNFWACPLRAVVV